MNCEKVVILFFVCGFRLQIVEDCAGIPQWLVWHVISACLCVRSAAVLVGERFCVYCLLVTFVFVLFVVIFLVQILFCFLRLQDLQDINSGQFLF